MYNKQYIPDARARYEDWDSMTEHQQQRVLNSMHEQLKRTNPKEAHRLRMAQYRANKQSTEQDRIDQLERTLEQLQETVLIQAGQITTLFNELDALKSKAIFASVL